MQAWLLYRTTQDRRRKETQHTRNDKLRKVKMVDD